MLRILENCLHNEVNLSYLILIIWSWSECCKHNYIILSTMNVQCTVNRIIKGRYLLWIQASSGNTLIIRFLRCRDNAAVTHRPVRILGLDIWPDDESTMICSMCGLTGLYLTQPLLCLSITSSASDTKQVFIQIFICAGKIIPKWPASKQSPTTL